MLLRTYSRQIIIFHPSLRPPLVAVVYGGMECRARSLSRSEGFLKRGDQREATNERGRNQMSYDPGAIMDTLRKEGLGLVTTGLHFLVS